MVGFEIWSSGTLVCLLLGAATTAQAQPSPVMTTPYRGVTVAAVAVENEAQGAADSEARITWPGFELLPDGGSRVFVQATESLRPQLNQHGQELRVRLGRAVLANGNAARPLDTRFFSTPVDTFYIDRKAGVATLVVKLRSKLQTQPQLETRRGEDGHYFLILQFEKAQGGDPPVGAHPLAAAPTDSPAIAPEP